LFELQVTGNLVNGMCRFLL